MPALSPQPWVLTAGSGTLDDLFTDLAFNSSSQLLVAGAGAFNGSSTGGRDLHLSLRDLRGRVIWQWNYGTSGDDALLAVAAAGTAIYAAGFLNSTNNSDRDAFVARFDSAGDLVASAVITSDTATDDQFNDLAVAPTGQIVLVGISRGNGKIGGLTKANPAPSGTDRGNGDGLITIISSSGSLSSLIGGSGDDGLEAVAVVPSGTAAGTILVAGYQTSNGGDLQGYLAAFDTAGTRKWERFLGSGTVAERLTAVVCDASTIYVAGTTRGLFPGAAAPRDPQRSDADAFVAAFDLSGQQLWARQLDDSALNEGTVQLALAGSRLELLTGDGADLRRVSFNAANGQQLSSELIASGAQGVENPEAIATDALGRVAMVGSTTGAWPERAAGGTADALLITTGTGLNADQLDIQPLDGQGLPQATSFQLDPGAGLKFAAGSYAALTGRVVIDAAGTATYTPYPELPELYAWTSTLQDAVQLNLTTLAGQPAGSLELVMRIAPAPVNAPNRTLALNANQAGGALRPYGLARPELLLNLSDTTYTTSLGASRNLSAFNGPSATVRLRLAVDKAPVTALNALRYARDQLYDRTIFHRVIDGFMVQGGGFSADTLNSASGFAAIGSFPQIPLEGTLSSGLNNQRGTIAMARTSNPHSATNQFFVNVVDNAFLNDKPPTSSDFSGTAGYAVFGAVASGLEVFDAIAKAPLRNAASGGNDAGWGAQNSGALFEDITEPVVVIEQATVSTNPTNLQVELITPPTFGTVSLNASSGSFLYKPSAGYNDSDSFEVRVTSPALPGLPERSVVQRVVITGTDGRATYNLAIKEGGSQLVIGDAAVFNLVTSNGSADLIDTQAAVSLILRARSTQTWKAQDIACNVGSADAPGTGQNVSLRGLAKYSFVASAIPAAVTTIELEPEKNSALFLHDAASAFHAGIALAPDAQQRNCAPRLQEIDTIRMGSGGGTSIVDLTSTDYLTGAITVHGAARGTSIVWGSSADDTVLSGGGDVVVYGGKGHNRLELGAGADTLQYRAGIAAQDVVSGFDPSRDRLQLWAGRGETLAAPSLSATATSTLLSWGENRVEFLGLPNLQLQQLQISYATARL